MGFLSSFASVVMKNAMSDLCRKGDSEPRNANIMKMLNLLGFGEHSGNGVPDIFSVWEEAGLAEHIIEEHFGEDGPNKTIVTLPLMNRDLVVFAEQPEKQPEKQPDTKAQEVKQRIAQVYDLIKQNPTISRADICKTLSISDNQVRTAIESMKEQGIIHREGSDRSGVWIIDMKL